LYDALFAARDYSRLDWTRLTTDATRCECDPV